MKTKIIMFCGISLLLMTSYSLFGQEFAPVKIKSGFNNDVIASGTGSVETLVTNGVDVDWALLSKNYKKDETSTPSSIGLPEDGLIKSLVNPAITFQLEPYDANNVLWLANSDDEGNLAFASPTAAKSLYMLATMGGNGSAFNTPTTADITIYFSDNSEQTISGINIYDWFEGNLNDAAIHSIGRINKYDSNITNPYTQPRLFQIKIDISSGNQNKNIVNIKVKKTNNNGKLNIFAFTAELYNPCSGVSNLNFIQNGSTNSITWDSPASAPSSGYDYYLSSYPTEPTNYTNPSGHLPVDATSIALGNLTTNKTYYFWIKSNCCSSAGIWKSKEFKVIESGTLNTNNTITNSKSLEVYPNPVDKIINFSEIQNISSVLINDASGKLIANLTSLKDNKLDVSYLKTGLYYITTNLKDGKKKTFKIIKK